MIIDFSAMASMELKNFKGGENSVFANMYVDPLCRIMRGTVPPGSSIGLHTHGDSCEIVYCLSGGGKAIYDGVEERILPGTAHYCPKGHSHTVINDGEENMVFIAIIPQQYEVAFNRAKRRRESEGLVPRAGFRAAALT